MKTASIAIATLLLTAPVVGHAQATPYKLIISWYQSNLTVIDYPNRERCEAAAKAVRAEVDRRAAENAPPGTVLVSKGPNGAFCIPG